ncbi:tetratricopeptide repeat protein [Lentisphaera profundi]|uniref:Tetratricopeptide repeat protein n=1 Tax=Lentisphaera profundi TaxID=1658616 RepID=A0ABY7VRU1_9BACT|nr:tetratricopeptide repeat protein [Lentisphaera profundi]WDE95607.1 tetratricopeptide repeat protein [Lentisphaera profundi]
MHKLFSVLVLFCSALFAVDQKNPQILEQANSNFEQAKLAALQNPEQAEGLYIKAINGYRFLIEEQGLRNSQLYNNLANAYFMHGEAGLAILNYHRALRLNPTDSDINHNLKYVQKQTNDVVPQNNFQEIINFVCFWHAWNPKLRLGIFFIFNLSFFFLCACSLNSKQVRIKKARLYTGIASLIFAISILTSVTALDQNIDGVIIAKETSPKQGNGYIYNNAFTNPLHAGTEFALLEERGHWLHIELLNGSTCWIKASDIALLN